MTGRSDQGWTANYLAAGRLQRGERLLVVVDEPLLEPGMQLVAAARDAGGDPRLELWTGERPLAAPPPAVVAAAAHGGLCIFIAQEPRRDEAGARIQLAEIVEANGGRELYSGLVDRQLLEGELSTAPPELAGAARKVLSQLDGKRTL